MLRRDRWWQSRLRPRDFYAVPTPQIKLCKASRRWHMGKVLFEKTWFRRWL